MIESKQLYPLPEVSVVMAIYNEPIEWIKLSIDSILSQTFRDFEFIIVNDNPNRTENGELINYYLSNDSRIVAINNDTNIGLTKSLNKGIRVAAGKYIARMDADDISMPLRFEKQVNILNRNIEVGICGTAVQLFGDKKGAVYYPCRNDSVFLFLDNCFAHPTVMMRREIAEMGYDESCRCSQDYDLWNRAFSAGILFFNIQEPLLFYRHSRQQISSSRRKEQMKTAQHIRRKAYDYYSRKNKLDLIMTGTTLSLDNILLLFNQTKLPSKEQSLFLYYLLLSTEDSFIALVSFVLRQYSVCKQISKMNILRVIYHAIMGYDNKKY